MKPHFLTTLFLALLLAACRPPISEPSPSQPSATATLPPASATATISATHTLAVTPTLEASATPTPPSNARTSYYLSAKLDNSLHALAVQEQITYTNRADTPLADLTLVVEPARWPGAFTLTSLAWMDGTPVDYHWNVQRMILDLPQPLARGGTVSLALAYTLAIPPIPTDAGRPVPFGYTLRQTNLVDWYPYIPPYDTAWLANDPGYFGEHQVYEIADFVVDVQIDTPPPGLVLAASAAARETSTGYRYELTAGRDFAISAGRYEVITATQSLPDGRALTVAHYGSPFVAAMAPQVLSDTMRAVQVFSDLFVPYPHDSLSVVQADFLDGMEYDGLFFLSDGFYNTYGGLPDDYLTAIAVHETAHQWWYALIGNDQALEPWLDEALSTYSEVLYYERVYPQALDAWWARRVDFYQPSGVIDLPVYRYPGFIPYRNAVYLRGARFLHDLRHRVGDEAFFAFLKDYAVQCAQKIAHAEDFFAILAAHSAADIGDLKQEYFAPQP
ncbi:MAG: M1 family aminopeptidase [Chloroflexota bacterium]